MAGDPNNARLWADADVYISNNLSATTPANASTAFAAEWSLVGLLDGDAGFVETRDEDVNDHYAWGGILMFTSRANFKLTRTFTAFEHNSVTRALRWPGSPAGTLKVPKPTRVKIAFETRSAKVIRRVIAAYQAEVAVDGDVTESEADPSGIPFLATIYPSASGDLFLEQSSAVVSS
jgi:hypothetical protein